jgi:dipeptidyl aminopeptidase/acylaminoacyl peptidase
MKIHFYTNVRLPRRKANFILVFILQLVACSLWGQVMQKRALTVADYSKWENLSLNRINQNGQWVSYNVSNKDGADTLFVRNTQSLQSYSFPSGNRGEFVTPNLFIVHTPRGLHLFNLHSGKEEILSNVDRYIYTQTAKKILILISDKQKNNTLLIRDLTGSSQQRIEGVYDFQLAPNNQIVLYAAKNDKEENRLYLLELKKNNRKKMLSKGKDPFSYLTWHKGSKSIAFIQNTPSSRNFENTLYYYNIEHEKLYQYSSQEMRRSFGDSVFIASSSHKLKISDTNEHIFFAVQRKEKSKNQVALSDVQIWNGNAKWVYPMEELEKPYNKPFLARWSPLENRSMLISNASLPEIMLTGNQDYALLSNKKQYEPQLVYEGPRDFYLVDLSTGKSNLLISKQSGFPNYIIPSPGGRYISYFSQKNWWIYDIVKHAHTNITGHLGQPYFHNEQELPENTETYPTLGWTVGDKEILLCDAYDIWAISPDGVSARRLTKGRETYTKFRWAGYKYRPSTQPNYNGSIHRTINLNEGLLFEASNLQVHSGYYKWTPAHYEKLVFSTNSNLNQLIISGDGNTFAYLEQRYDLSPKLMLYNKTSKETKTIFESNPQQKQFYWGESKLIQYKNSKGKSLQGALYYPADYDPEKKYPMIVFIYEKLSHHLHKYINPSQFTGDGQFNITTFTTQGYFVLAPDISYEVGNPGISATDCVVSATKEVIRSGLVQPNKIGLIGHSFGGYEADFIVTQTDIFAAAVAGAAATDLASFYLTLGWNTGRPDMWRFESQQWRMGKHLWDDKEGYERNSPVMHAQHITTPLLSWAGNEDRQVNWSQSVEFYLALRRLKKKHIMLLYSNEGHSLKKSENQKDLSIKLHEWFDYHLKDSTPATWIKKGLM